MKRILTLALTMALLLSATLSAAALPIFTEEDDGSTVEIYDGVFFTKAGIPKESDYKVQKFNIVEFDLADQSLDLQILKRDSIAAKQTITTYSAFYEAYNQGSQVLAAVNGDLWMTENHSNKNVTTKVLTVPRGVLMNDGVLFCSSQTLNETTYTTNGEGFGYFWGFGITNDYVPMIGQPIVSFDVKNVTKSLSTTTLALNRLPAHDSLVIYTGDLEQNYALADAYEIVLSDIEGEFRFNKTVKGTVSAIYPSNSAEKPALSQDTVVLTARGTAIDSVKDYVIGDKVEIDVSVSDASGRNNNWADAKLIIGGHIPSVLDGAPTGIFDNTHYPATIVGYKNDGTMFFFQNDGRNYVWSQGLQITRQAEILVEMGVNCCMNLDGGGSSTMVVQDKLVNRPSDAGNAARAVINGLALVTTTEERAPQADFKIKLPLRYNADYLAFDSEGAFDVLNAGYRNATDAAFNEEGYVRLTVPHDTNDPYIYYSMTGGLETVSANEYKYVVMKYRTSDTITTPRCEFFLCAGDVSGATGGKSLKFDLGPAGQWNTAIVDLTQIDYWKNDIYGLRIDYFAGNAVAGEFMDIEYIALAKTLEEAQAYSNGTAEIEEIPPQDNTIHATGKGYSIVEGNYLCGVIAGSTVYNVMDNISGPKIEAVNKKGELIRNTALATGDKIRSYNMDLTMCSELTVVMAGDVNLDGRASSLDAAQVLKYDALMIDIEGVLKQTAADANGDGVINSLDAAMILRMDAGIITP